MEAKETLEERAFQGLAGLIESLQSRTGRWLIGALLGVAGWVWPTATKGIKSLIEGGSFDDFGQLLFGLLALIAGGRALWTNAYRQWQAATKPPGDPKAVEKPGFSGERQRLPMILKQRALPKSAPPPEFGDFIADQVTVTEAEPEALAAIPIAPRIGLTQADRDELATEALAKGVNVVALFEHVAPMENSLGPRVLKDMARKFIAAGGALALLLLPSCKTNEFIDGNDLGVSVNVNGTIVTVQHQKAIVFPKVQPQQK